MQYDRYEADNLQPEVLPGVSSAAYDVAGWTFGVQAGYLLTEVDTLSISCSRRHDTVTAVTPPDLEILEYSSAVARDPVFSGNPIAYRIIADADTLSINWSHAIGHYSSVNLGYAYRRTRGTEVEDQIDKEFVPYVQAIRVGSYVKFPNKDNIRYHVYSFSPAKKFELPLYSGTPASPVLFDKVGVVKLGCKLYDWMIGYV